MRFGSPTNFGSGDVQAGSQLSDYFTVEGLYGFLISPGHSIFIYLPIAIMYPFSLYFLYKKNKALAILFIYLSIVTYFYIGLLDSWLGATAQWGPNRYLLTLVPLVIISSGTLIERSHELFWKLSVIILSSIGFVINFLGNLVWIMYALSYGWGVEGLWKAERPGVHIAWDPFYAPYIQAIKVLITNYSTNLQPNGTDYHIIGLYGCQFDLFIFCKFGIVPVIAIAVAIIVLACLILKLLKNEARKPLNS
ncbi:MAG: hypothetical protein GKS07_02750 [Nitrosopumilus sp.]|nr:MAG: hypothetical protein GKS07_02750 [Nitrosopumilus sp.]